MLKKISISFIIAAMLGIGYGCKSKKLGCDCPTFGNHSTGKAGVYKNNSKNKH